MTKIDIVEILDPGEQIAWVLTGRGGFVVTPVPDARTEALEDCEILARADSLAVAQEWVRKEDICS